MKRFVILLFALGFSTLANAQSVSSFGAFISNPLGDFGSEDIENGGYAESGWGLVFDSKTKFQGINHWGYRSHSTYSWNNLNTEAMARDFTDELGLETQITDSRYSPLYTSIGPNFEAGLGDFVAIELYGLAGIVFTDTRAFTITVFDEMGDQLFKEVVNFDNNVAFGYNFGADIRFSVIPDMLFLSLYADYMAANQKSTLSFDTENLEGVTQMRFLNFGLKLAVVPTQK